MVFEKINQYTHHFACALLMLFFAVGAHRTHAASYTVTGPTTPYTWVDISASPNTVALADDSVSAAVNIGFTFNFGGLDYTQLIIGSNGWIFFGTSSTVFTNTTVATSPVTNVMMPYWDDLNPASVATRVRYQTVGTAPNRQFVVSYLAVPTYNITGANTFQVVLNENGSFLYNYQATNDQGVSATVGYDVSATDLVQFSFNTASVPNLRTLTWRRIPPILANAKTVTLVSDPVNGVTNPKNIPGAVSQYAIRITNSALGGVVDNGRLTITEPIPSNAALFTGALSGTAPFIFADGAPVSGLSCSFTALNSTTDCVDFSNDGGITWVYVPNGAYDAAVTHVRFKFAGVMAANTGAGNPFFDVKFNVQIK
jgi:hypothetical protein